MSNFYLLLLFVDDKANHILTDRGAFLFICLLHDFLSNTNKADYNAYCVCWAKFAQSFCYFSHIFKGLICVCCNNYSFVLFFQLYSGD
jgi:hypothetical protein